jgi:hypothetical protein
MRQNSNEVWRGKIWGSSEAYLVLDKLDNIDSTQKYEKVKAILRLKELTEQSKVDFLASTFTKSDNERKFLLWSEKYVEEISLETLAEKMIGWTPTTYSNPFQNTFIRLNFAPIQSQVLSLFSNKLGNIDCFPKYEKVKAILGLKELPEQTKKDFLLSTFAKSDSERKFLFWSEKYVDEVDIETVVDKMINETTTAHSNPFQKTFVRLNIEPIQSQVLSLVSNKLGNIDNLPKYEKVKAILGLKELPEQTKKDFLLSTFAKSDRERKFLFWFEQYVDEVDIETVVDKMINETTTTYSNPFQKIFERITNLDAQSQIVSLFLNKLGSIDNHSKYEKVKAILGVKELSEKAKKDFLCSAFIQSDNEQKFLLWYEGIVHEFDVQYIIEGFAKYKFKKFSYQILFSRLTEDAIKIEIISKVFNQLDKIDDFVKYNEIKKMLTLDFISDIIKPEMLNAIFQKSSYVNKLRLSNDFNQYFDYDVKIATEAALNCTERVFEISLLFDYLIGYEQLGFEKTTWLNSVILELGVSDGLAFLNQISKVHLIKPIKNKFAGIPLIKLIGVKSPNDITYVNDNLSLFPSEYYAQIKSFYHLVSNSGYYRSYSSWQHTKNYSDRILCIEYILKSEILSDQSLLDYYQNTDKTDYINELEYLKSFKELNLVLGAENKDNLIHALITAFIGGFQSAIKDFAKSIKEEALINLLKNIKYLDKEFLDVFLQKELNDFSIPIKLKLWVYDVIDYFDFNQFYFYYFTLNSVERSIFNKKAKARMGATLKQAMLKQREPWEFIKADNESSINKYSATWRSIWFDEGEIRFCINTNCDFSRAFTWDFSEEKFNLLFDYISGRRLKELTIWAKDNIVIKVEGLEELEEVIWKVQIQKEVETGVDIGLRGKSGNRIPINMILRNQCIQLLNQFQLNELEPTRVLEKTFNLEKGGLTVDISLLYSIPINKNEIAIIWESLELEKSKATHIFKCSRDQYGEILSDVEFYLQSKSKVRSSLNSNNFEDVERQKKMKYLCRIDHDNFDFSKWEKSLCEALPELKPLTSNKSGEKNTNPLI